MTLLAHTGGTPKGDVRWASNGAAWYLDKALECDRLAKGASSPEDRALYENEARTWRDIAADIAKAER